MTLVSHLIWAVRCWEPNQRDIQTCLSPLSPQTGETFGKVCHLGYAEGFPQGAERVITVMFLEVELSLSCHKSVYHQRSQSICLPIISASCAPNLLLLHSSRTYSTGWFCVRGRADSARSTH